jgi:hypothetical protein
VRTVEGLGQSVRDHVSQIEFKAPGPGAWELEQTHFAKPATRYASTLVADPLAKGFGEGTRRYGLLLDTLRMRFVNDFCYGKFVGVGAPDNASGAPRDSSTHRGRPGGVLEETLARGHAAVGRGGQT